MNNNITNNVNTENTCLQTENENIHQKYNELLRENKKQSRELALLKKQIERSKVAAEAKDNVNRVISEKRSELERYLNLLMENFPDIVLLFGADNRLIYCTNSFLWHCRIPAVGMVRGLHYRELLEPYLSDAFLNEIQNITDGLVEQVGTLEFDESISFDKHNKPRNYRIQITPMHGENKQIEGSMVVFYDTTEIMRAKKEAERANAAKSDFLATVSHEIRTPMNAIMGVSEMLKSMTMDEKQHEYLRSIQNSSNVLLNLINDILDFSKIEAGKLELIPEYFTLDAMLRHLKTMFDLMFKQKKLEFNCNFDENLPPIVYGDEGRIRQIITNLLNNALKYTEHGSINFNAYKRADGNICFEVKDTGIGIKPEALPKLFTAFEQLDLVRNKTISGTGLGLAITKHLCKRMNGTIEVESDYGGGSVFRAVLPLKEGREEDLPGSRRDDTVDFTALGTKVLIVDDIEINLEITQYMLSPYRVKADIATSGKKAIELVETNKYDIIFMDHMMPNMDGVEATGHIRTLGGYASNVPVIALTANAVSGAMEMFLANGFNDFLSKPVDDYTLNAILLKWLPSEKIIVKQKNKKA